MRSPVCLCGQGSNLEMPMEIAKCDAWRGITITFAAGEACWQVH